MTPDESLATILLASPTEFADVAELATFPAVVMVARLVSSIEPDVVTFSSTSMNKGDDVVHDDDVNELVVNDLVLTLFMFFKTDEPN
jgi:hypothetical protein